MFCTDRAAFLYSLATNVGFAVLAVGLPVGVLLFLFRRKSRRPSC